MSSVTVLFGWCVWLFVLSAGSVRCVVVSVSGWFGSRAGVVTLFFTLWSGQLRVGSRRNGLETTGKLADSRVESVRASRCAARRQGPALGLRR